MHIQYRGKSWLFMYPVIRFVFYFRMQVLLIFLSHLKGIVPEEALSGNKDVKLAGKSWYEYNLNNHLMSLCCGNRIYLISQAVFPNCNNPAALCRNRSAKYSVCTLAGGRRWSEPSLALSVLVLHLSLSSWVSLILFK